MNKPTPHHLKYFSNTYGSCRASKFPLVILFFCVLILLVDSARAQANLPDEIRGYKVYNAKIAVRVEPSRKPPESGDEVSVKIGEPELTDVSFGGVTIELPAEITSSSQSGTVDFLTFYDFRVNGAAVAIEEYKYSFEIKKNQSVKLPKPIKISISAKETLRGAFSELTKMKNTWTVTGTIFVFGRFKKLFFKFKRVVPFEINLQIENPLKQLTISSYQSSKSAEQ